MAVGETRDIRWPAGMLRTEMAEEKRVTFCSKQSWLRGLATCFIWSSLGQQRKFLMRAARVFRVIQDECSSDVLHYLGGADGRSHAEFGKGWTPVPVDRGLKVPSYCVITTEGHVDPRAAITDVVLKRFEQPDETGSFELGRFELVTLGGMTIGRATYLPGWRWSRHVGASVGATHCTVEHIGLVLSGHATAVMRDGRSMTWSPARSFTSRPSRTIAGLWATSLTFHYISWAPTCMPKSRCPMATEMTNSAPWRRDARARGTYPGFVAMKKVRRTTASGLPSSGGRTTNCRRPGGATSGTSLPRSSVASVGTTTIN